MFSKDARALRRCGVPLDVVISAFDTAPNRADSSRSVFADSSRLVNTFIFSSFVKTRQPGLSERHRQQSDRAAASGTDGNGEDELRSSLQP